MIDLFIDMSYIYGYGSQCYTMIIRRDETDASAFDDDSSSVIELLTTSKQETGNTYLMLRQVGK